MVHPGIRPEGLQATGKSFQQAGTAPQRVPGPPKLPALHHLELVTLLHVQIYHMAVKKTIIRSPGWTNACWSKAQCVCLGSPTTCPLCALAHAEHRHDITGPNMQAMHITSVTFDRRVALLTVFTPKPEPDRTCAMLTVCIHSTLSVPNPSVAAAKLRTI
jgi:hypothetical protein